MGETPYALFGGLRWIQLYHTQIVGIRRSCRSQNLQELSKLARNLGFALEGQGMLCTTDPSQVTSSEPMQKPGWQAKTLPIQPLLILEVLNYPFLSHPPPDVFDKIQANWAKALPNQFDSIQIKS